MLTFLKGAGTWLLKILLTGLGIKMRTQEQEAAERERDAALARAKSVEDSAALEVKAAEDAAVIDKKFAEDKAKRPADDPFGTDDWNKGTD